MLYAITSMDKIAFIIYMHSSSSSPLRAPIPTPHDPHDAKILITKGNPSRGRGYEVAHFVVLSGQLKNVADRDVFFPSLTKAAHWVWRVYPTAKLATGRRDHKGALAALCFRCAPSDLHRV